MTKYCVDCKIENRQKPTTASFNFHDKQPMYCKEHKKEGMINIKEPLCFCKKGKPTYNFQGNKAGYCKECKQSNMINVASKMCIDCKKCKPSFNVPGKAPDYCSKCAKKYDNMVNVNNKKCCFVFSDKSQCGNNPLFNLPGKKGGMYCSSHAPDGYIDVFHSKCIYEDKDGGKCNLSPSYNFMGKKELLYCSYHFLDGMVNVKHPLCKLCNLIHVNQVNNEGLCFSCFAFTYPESVTVKNFLVKERFIVNYLKDKHPEYTWRYNKFLNSCIKYRPDLLLDLGTHVIIIEIDEHQHNTELYKDCDLKRTYDILAELARPLIMLRINPDAYKNGETKHKPIFKNVKKQLVLDENIWKERQVTIDAEFQKCRIAPTELFTQVNLFFDSNLSPAKISSRS